MNSFLVSGEVAFSDLPKDRVEERCPSDRALHGHQLEGLGTDVVGCLVPLHLLRLVLFLEVGLILLCIEDLDVLGLNILSLICLQELLVEVF